MSTLTDTLNYILDRRIALDPKFVSTLRPGLSRENILEMTRDIPCKLPEELIELYEWHNGADYVYDNFIPVFEFRPLEYAVETNGRYDEIDDTSLSIMDLNGDVQLAIILGKDYGLAPIYCIDLECGVCEQCFDSLTTMFQTFAACFDEDLYWWDEELKTIQSRNYESYCQIHKRYNPNSTPLDNSYFGDYPKITFAPIKSTKNGTLALIWSVIFILIIRQIFLWYLT
jgi:SMI1 / KNR4 family (SUKH-1)